MGHAEEAQRRAREFPGFEPRRDGEGPHLLSPDGQRPRVARRRDEPVQSVEGAGPALFHPRDGRRRDDPVGGEGRFDAARVDRKGVVSGRSGSVRVEYGGGGVSEKKKTNKVEAYVK